MPTIPKDMKGFLIDYWDGVNATVGPSVSKPQEPVFAENVRSNTVGVLETRDGLTAVGDSGYLDKVTLSLESATSFAGLYNSSTIYRCGMFKIGNRGTSLVSVSQPGTSLRELRRIISSGVENFNDPVGSPILNSTNLLEIGDNTTQWNITQPGSGVTRFTWNTSGTNPNILQKMSVGTTVTITGTGINATNRGTRIVSAFTSSSFDVYAPAYVSQTGVTADAIQLPLTRFSGVEAEGSLFYTTKGRTPLQLDSQYDPISNSFSDPVLRFYNDTSSSIYDMPRGAHIEYFKSKLYVANIKTSSGVEYQNSMTWSSNKVGLISLVDGDFSTGATTIKVTDTKYIRSSDSLDIIRGGVYKGTLTITAKTEDSITVTATGFDIKSSDQIWVKDTFSTAKALWRWDTNSPPGSPLNTSSIQVGTNADSEITCLQTVGNFLMVGTRTSTSGWNGTAMTALSTDIGVVSHEGWVTLGGTLYFVSSRGIYRTAGGGPERISTPIRRIYDYTTKSGRENSVMWKMGDSIYAYVGPVSVPTDDNSVNKVISNCVFEFDTVQENWYIHSYGASVDEANSYNSDLNADDCLVAFNDGSTSITNHFMSGTTDNSNDIFMRVDSSTLYLNSAFEKPSYLWFANLDLLQGDGVKMFLTPDDYDTYEIDGEFKKGLNTLTLNGPPSDSQSEAPRARKVRISFRAATKKKIKLGRFRIDYSMSTEMMPEPDKAAFYS